MTRQQLYKRNRKIADYLSTPRNFTLKGEPVYPTILEAAVEFNLSINQIFIIKKDLLGLDEGIERKLKSGSE